MRHQNILNFFNFYLRTNVPNFCLDRHDKSTSLKVQRHFFFADYCYPQGKKKKLSKVTHENCFWSVADVKVFRRVLLSSRYKKLSEVTYESNFSSVIDIRVYVSFTSCVLGRDAYVYMRCGQYSYKYNIRYSTRSISAAKELLLTGIIKSSC